jgi:ParB-like chromosome segregation protein Spo0J
MSLADTSFPVESVPFEKINPAPYNPRRRLRPGGRQYESLRRSITEFGLVEPLVWNRQTGNLVGGHQRMAVLADLGHVEAPCLVVDLPLSREKVLNVALNKVQGEWDREALTELITEIAASEEEVTLTGFDGNELDRLLLESVEHPEYEFTEELLEEHNYVVLYFDNEMDWQAAVETLGIKQVATVDSRPGYERKGTGRVLRGAPIVRRLIDGG